MNTLSRYRELFIDPTTADKLKFFQYLFEARELDVNLALALLKVIHKELSLEKSKDRSMYKRYAEVIANLRYHKRDMLKQVVDAWNAGKTTTDPEWLSDGVIK